jgi:hypothetical protein
MTVMRNVRVFEEDTELAMSPMARVQAITSVYLPEFEDDIKALDHSVDAYELWAMEARGRRLKKEPDFADGGSEAYEPYLENFHSLMRKLRGYARKEFQ